MFQNEGNSCANKKLLPQIHTHLNGPSCSSRLWCRNCIWHKIWVPSCCLIDCTSGLCRASPVSVCGKRSRARLSLSLFIFLKKIMLENIKYSLRLLLPILIRMYLDTKMCPDTSVLGQVIVVKGSTKINYLRFEHMTKLKQEQFR
jgi:hypothetical protein